MSNKKSRFFLRVNSSTDTLELIEKNGTSEIVCMSLIFPGYTDQGGYERTPTEVLEFIKDSVISGIAPKPEKIESIPAQSDPLRILAMNSANTADDFIKLQKAGLL
jgi:hypothetical protein